MYTVLKVITNQRDVIEKVDKVGRSVNEIIPGAFTGIRKAGDGFACDVSEAQDWEEHQNEIKEFVLKIKDSILAAKKTGFNIILDLAIESDDLKVPAKFLRFNDEVLDLIVKSNLQLELSIYMPCYD